MAPPAARVAPQVLQGVFNTPFPRVRFEAWSPSLLSECLPKGSPGPDGWTSSRIAALSDDSQSALCMLLDLADEGRSCCRDSEA